MTEPRLTSRPSRNDAKTATNLSNLFLLFSTGVPGKIQATQATATLLIEAGKEHWVRLREDNVHAKGKGVLQTYWITPHTKKDASNTSSEAAKGSNHNADAVVIKATDTATKNLLRHESHIDWIVEMLQEWIRNIIAHRQARNIERQPIIMPKRQQDRIALDELVEVINLPDFDSTAAGIPNPSTIQINENIRGLLREYISIVSTARKVKMVRCLVLVWGLQLIGFHFPPFSIHDYR